LRLTTLSNATSCFASLPTGKMLYYRFNVSCPGTVTFQNWVYFVSFVRDNSVNLACKQAFAPNHFPIFYSGYYEVIFKYKFVIVKPPVWHDFKNYIVV